MATWEMLILWLTVLPVFVSVDGTDIVEFTSGTSGDACGAHTCLDSVATCHNGRCKCLSPLSKGFGNFLCVKPTDYFCAVLNDPKVIGYDGSVTNVPLMSRFPLTQVKTTTCSNSQNTDGICDVTLHAWVQRVRGKNYIRGFEAEVNVIYQGQSYSGHFQISTYAVNGNYTYLQSEDTVTFPDHTPITFIYDTVNNFAKLNMEACGIEVGIRGAEQEGSPFNMPAGVYVKVDTQCNSSPYFGDSTGYICSAPDGFTLQDFTTAFSEAAGRNVPSGMVLLLLSIILNPQGLASQPSFPSLETTVTNCELNIIFDAFELCYFIIDDPRFFKCYDDTEGGDVAIQLLTSCCSALCNRNQTECENLKEQISNSGCSGGIRSPQETILNMECEF